MQAILIVVLKEACRLNREAKFFWRIAPSHIAHGVQLAKTDCNCKLIDFNSGQQLCVNQLRRLTSGLLRYSITTQDYEHNTRAAKFTVFVAKFTVAALQQSR